MNQLIPKGDKVAVLSSPAGKATGSAEIIALKFDVAYSVCTALSSDYYEDGNRLANAIVSMGNGADAIIAVTHFAAPSGIINALSTNHFTKRVPPFECSNGGGCMICLKTGMVTKEI